jgi:hypothetical protein
LRHARCRRGEAQMFQENVREGFEVFIHDGDKAIGAVRKFSPHGRRELVIYVASPT